MNRSLRGVARIAAVSVLAVGAVPLGSAVHADGIRTETGLAGFSVGAEASPLLVLLDDPKLEIPRDTGTAAAEGDPNYTLASVSTGPNARAIASTLWPGNLLGEGLAQLSEGAPPYPIKAESRYPDTPYTANGVDGGVLSRSSAMGLDATATADGAPTNQPGQVTVGGATSTSTATVTDKDVAVGSAVSAVHDVTLLGGLIKVDDVTTRLTTSTDGKTATSVGSTTVSGLRIGDVGYTVDDKGVHVASQGSALPQLPTPKQLDDLGISVEALAQTSTKTANSATRTASGLVIRIDTVTLAATLKPAIGAIRDPYSELVGKYVPKDQQGYFYYLLKATPNITFVLAAGKASTAATLPITFSFPPNEFPPAGGGLVGGPTLGGTAPGSTSVPPGLVSEPPSVVAPTVPGPVLQAPGSRKAAAIRGVSSPSVGGLLVLTALAASGLVGWGLTRFLGLAGGVLGLGCRLGAPTTVPNLRSVTS